MASKDLHIQSSTLLCNSPILSMKQNTELLVMKSMADVMGYHFWDYIILGVLSWSVVPSSLALRSVRCHIIRFPMETVMCQETKVFDKQHKYLKPINRYISKLGSEGTWDGCFPVQYFDYSLLRDCFNFMKESLN